jgi:RHS repeat-associated protein
LEKFHCAFLTQKERDSESGLDYFLARYYSSAQGRFTSPDEPFADQDAGDPQSWNLYSYAGNSPLFFVDQSGLFKKVVIDGKEYWQVEPGDQEDYARLSKKTGIPEGYLRKGFGNQNFNPGELLDVTGARQLYIQAEFSRFVSIVPSDQVPPAVRYSIDIGPPIPLPAIGRIASGRIAQLTQKALDHIVLRHWATSGAKGAGKFLAGTTGKEVKSLIEDAVQKGAKSASRFGRTEYVQDFGRQIGTDIKGRVASRLKVVVEASGEVVTAYPIK